MGKRLAAINRKKREAKKREEQVQLERGRVNQYYGIGAVIAVGVICIKQQMICIKQQLYQC